MLKRVLGVVLALLLLVQGYLPAQESIFGGAAARPELIEVTEPEAGLASTVDIPTDPVEAILAQMDLKQKICQLLIVTPEGLSAPSNKDMAFINAYPPGGVIIRRSAKPIDARRYVAKVRGVEQVNGIPLLVGADLYRLVQRDRGMASGFVQLPSLFSIAAAHDTSAASDLGELLAEHMQTMGFNFYFGPSLELAPRINTAVGSIHTFGSDPEFAASAAQQIAAELNKQGVLPMPVGFPGGGANHERAQPAVLTTPRVQLPKADLLPYIKAIEEGARIIHVGNVLTPTLSEPVGPASLSRAVVTDLLRGELGFDGVIVAGPMDGSDLVVQGDNNDAALAALNAGADMLLWDRADSIVMDAVAHIEAAVKVNALDEAVIDTAVERVLRLKISHAERQAELGKSKSMLPTQRKMEETVREMERRAITVIQNRGNVLPLREQTAMPVLVTGVVGARDLRDVLQKHMEPISQRELSTAQSLGRIERFEVERITKYVRGIRTAVLVLTEDIEAEGALELIRGLRGQGIRVVVVLLGYPSIAPQLFEAEAIVLAYCDSATYVQTLKEIGHALAGEGAVGILSSPVDLEASVGVARSFNAMEVVRTPPGRLPVNLGDLYPAGLAAYCSPEFAIRKAQWDFGDGKKSKDIITTHSYDEPGRYPLTLTVVDQNKIGTERTFYVNVSE